MVTAEGRRSLRRIAFEQLETERLEGGKLSATNRILVFVILLSIGLYTAETEIAAGSDDAVAIGRINEALLWVFAAEFAVRLWSVGAEARFRGGRGLWAYVRANGFMLAVDFLAFAPELVWLAFAPTSPSFLRSLRVVRLLKIARYYPSCRLVLAALRSCYQELLVALSLSAALWYLSSVTLYVLESDEQPEKFGSILRAMWWGVATLTTVGYGDVYPQTIGGKVAAGFFAVIGVGTVALPSGIIAGAFIEKYRARRQALAARSADAPTAASSG